MTNHAQGDAFGRYGHSKSLIVLIDECLALCGDYGFTVDEGYELMKPVQTLHGWRTGVYHRREAGVLKDSGMERPGWADHGGAMQTVWVPGDDRHIIHAQRVEKMHKLCAYLGYRAVPLSDDDNA